jgi:hypothetical protein
MTHSVCLEEGFLNEPKLPTLKCCRPSIEDSVVSLLPDEPGTQHEDLHEERLSKLFLSFLHHLVKRKVEVPGDAQVIPALPAEGAVEEQMECCLFPIKRADWAVIVVTL